ncbi:Alpha/Beta hydrolase protein [Microdochium trichocladiopsis]|uniref:Carboxylic ester hydrolase n=1 Tax=Microdochium trichocladiopsis TaxID=1682393 RepID=A0A9P9BQ21_9PEZI|nr:Alpha/Beta hydrolase protein [Microdochium trichocladiopsis]KAH7029874.1 Alpha/Beta hydrolase protein [Microdochium trichocladiopsis]
MGNSISYTTTPHELDLGAKGAIRGLQYDNKARRYAGVPFALPPTGQHRWRKPRPLPADHVYSGDADDDRVFDATRFRTLCPQKAFHVGEGGSADKYSEDCLFVNIWTPVEKPDNDGKETKWPVMLWLHGGWFQMGDPSHEAYMDPTELISSGGLDAIVVAIGYRLNVFGFLAGQALHEESGGEAAGNYGLWDQRLGAEWVRDNIAAFGGDPDNITLAGRSAGAYSVEAQMLYELRRSDADSDRSLYRRAFMDSNAIPAQPKSLADAEPQFDELCTHFSIPSILPAAERLSKLRDVSAEDLVAALEKLENHTFRPVTDDIFIHDGMVQYLSSSEFGLAFKERGYKLLIGEVLNEETLYATYNSPESPTLEALKMQVGNYYAPATVERALAYYDLPRSTELQDWKNCFGRIIADGQVRAPSRALAQNLLRNGVPISDIWRYQIAYRLSFITEKIAPMSMGVAHAMDKPFWNFCIGSGPTAAERKLMEDWIQILVRFVQDNRPDYNFGTRAIDEMKMITPEGTIEIRKDPRWEELERIGAIFAGETK